MHDFSKHTFRASSIGHIMADPRGNNPIEAYDAHIEKWAQKQEAYAAIKNKETKTAQNALIALDKMSAKAEILEKKKDKLWLSDTTKKHLADIYTVVTTGRTEDIKSKYLEKGLMMEEDAITAYCLLTGNMHRKNHERRYNEFVEGELDFVDEDTVYDTKVNWSIFQYNRVVGKELLPLYEWQMQTYMWLWNKPKARLIYTLIDTPEKLIQAEFKKLQYTFIGSEKEYLEACDEIRFLHTYTDIPAGRKSRPFDLKRDDEKIDRIKERVKLCREYLNNFDKQNFEFLGGTEDEQSDESDD